jgi:hypothetical protein
MITVWLSAGRASLLNSRAVWGGQFHEYAQVA